MRLRPAAARVALVGLVMLAGPRSVAGLDEAAFSPYSGATVTEITLSGNRTTRESTIWKWLQLREGDAFDYDLLEDDVGRLENLSIFGFIDVEPTDSRGGVALRYVFREMPSYLPYLAVRYTEENGFSVGPALSAVNLGGRGARVSGRFLVGGTTTFVLNYRDPWISSSKRRMELDLSTSYLTRDDTLNEFVETSVEITPWFARHYGHGSRIEGMIGYFQMGSDVDGITLTDNDLDDFLRVGAAFGVDTRDSWRDPAQGWWTEIETEIWAGDGTFLSTNFDVRRWQPVGSRSKFFLGGLASLRSGTVGEDVPQYLMYRMGGANSIRGYDVNFGKTLYGKNQFIGMVEYHFDLLPLRTYDFFRWSALIGMQLAVFSDIGSAWSSRSELTGDRVKTGVGFGLRLLVPGTEMTRFDLAFGDDNGIDVYFHFGNWAKWTAQRSRLR